MSFPIAAPDSLDVVTEAANPTEPAAITTGVDPETRQRLAATFDTASHLYDRARPGYATAAIDWVLPENASVVLDLAAGTGKLTAGLTGRGLDVVAIDPSPAMLAVLRETMPEIEVRLGTAEQTGLADATVDAIFIGSALHWFERPAADREMHRVLRPGGVVGVVGNVRDVSQTWVIELNELVDAALDGGVKPDNYRVPLDSGLFTEPEVRRFPYSQTLDPDLLAELVASRSYVIAMEPARRDALMAQIRELAATHPDLAGRSRFELRYETIVSRFRRR